MTYVYTPRHPPCVGGASKLHGHPQSQLHSPRSDPDIRHFETIFRDRAVREWAADDKDAAISQLERPPEADSATATDLALSSSCRLPQLGQRRKPPPPPQLASLGTRRPAIRASGRRRRRTAFPESSRAHWH